MSGFWENMGVSAAEGILDGLADEPSPPTLGEIQRELQGLVGRGASVESIRWVLDHKVVAK